MIITLLQQNIVWADTAANQRAAEAAILAAPKSDVYVLPEMWSTGFATDPAGIAERDGSSLRWMQQMADRMDAAIAGSVAVEEEDPLPAPPVEGESPMRRGGNTDTKFFNRFYFVKPGEHYVEAIDSLCTEHTTPPPYVTGGGKGGGSSSYYDKHHLFTYGGEHHRYSAGDRRVVAEWRGVRFLLQTCYDLRFPVFSRNSIEGPEAYDVALYVASWPKSRRLPWDTLLRARAIENQCYVCGINRVGDDPVCHYNGGTTVIDAYGRTLAECPDDEVGSITATIDMEALRAFRKKFPVLGDRD